MNRLPASLWRRFATIAQPYFFPPVPGGGWATVLLLVMLLVLVFTLLCLSAAGLVLAAGHWAPQMLQRIAPGLQEGVLRLHQAGGVWLVLVGLALPMGIFAAFGRHLHPRRQAWTLLAVVLLLSLAVTGINVAFSYVGNYFTNALVKKDQDLAYLLVAVYFGGFLAGIPIVAMYQYVQGYLGMRWRQWLTDQLLERYFAHRRYYEIEAAGRIDNPDQRIMEDIRSFTRTSLGFLLIVLGALMDLISFTGILWSKSVLLVAVVIGYSLAGTALTVWFGRRLVRLNFTQLRYEADFRYALVHLRDHAESIAFYQGERPEAEQIAQRFGRVLKNFGLLIGWQRNLSFFTTAYSYLPLVLPFIVLFPPYFGGSIEYGDMVQANFAFLQVYGALSLIVSQIEEITGFAAGVERLSDFAAALDPDPAQEAGIRSAKAEYFALHDLTVQTPDRSRTLIRKLRFDPQKAVNLAVVGPSGAGKSSLLRAIAGLWTRGAGTVHRPPLEQIFFLPQKPYMLLGSLRHQLLYPRVGREAAESQLQEALAAVGLGDLPERVGGLEAELDWADLLSLGEQQRLAFARLFLNRPRFAVLDEATSALDLENEAHLYRQLARRGIHYISVGHRPSILAFHDQVLRLRGPSGWQVISSDRYPLQEEG